MGAPKPGLHEGLARMRERPVAYIVEERGDQNEQPVLWCKPELTARDTGKVHCSDRVFEPGVAGAGVNKERKPELPDIAQALDRR